MFRHTFVTAEETLMVEYALYRVPHYIESTGNKNVITTIKQRCVQRTVSISKEKYINCCRREIIC